MSSSTWFYLDIATQMNMYVIPELVYNLLLFSWLHGKITFLLDINLNILKYFLSHSFFQVNAYIMSIGTISQLFWQDSFELPRGEPSRDADIELGQQPPISAAEQGLEGFFKQVPSL